MPNEVVAGLMVSIDGNTVKLRSELDKAQQKTRETGQQMKKDFGEARGTVMVLGEEIGVHLPRHVQKFVAELPGAAKMLSAAFSTVAVVAIGAAILEAGKKAYEFGAKMRAVAGDIGQSMDKMLRSTQASNDELALSNAKMAEQIAKLEHKPVNSLGIALAEARVEADKLAQSLGNDIDAMRKLFQEKSVSAIGGLLTGQAGTRDAENLVQKHLAAIAAVDSAEQDALANAKTGDNVDKIRHDAQIGRLAALRNAIKETGDAWNTAHARQNSKGEGQIGPNGEIRAGNGYLDQTANLTVLGTASHQFEVLFNKANMLGETSVLSGRLALDEGKKAGADANKAALAAAKAAAEARMKVLEDELAKRKGLIDAAGGDLFAPANPFQKTQQQKPMTTQEEYSFWESKLGAEGSGSLLGPKIQEKIAPLVQKALEERARGAEEWTKLMDALGKSPDKEKFDFSGMPEMFRPDARMQKNQSEGDAAGMEARRDRTWLLQENAMAQDVLNSKEAEESGHLRKGTTAILEQKDAIVKLQHELEELQDRRAAALKTAPGLRKPGDNPDVLQNQILQTQGQINLGGQSLNYLESQQKFGTNMNTMFADWEEHATDLKSIMGEFFSSSMNALNDQLVKMMTTQYHQGDWKKAVQPIFTGAAKSSLEYGEGSLMKAFGIGGKRGESKSKPMYVQDVGLGSVGGIGSASGAASVADSASQSGGFFNGFFKGIGSFFGGMETGGLMKPGGFYLTGERGPELLRVGSTTRINNARDTSRIMSSGGGSHVEHHYHIDARGATDPAAVTAAINRAISRAAPQIAASSIAAMQDMKARRPAIYG